MVASADEERFWPKVDKNGPGGCWVWTAGKDRGYGRFYWRGGQLAHRFCYELLVGPIPEGLDLDHLCRNPSCVNPSHLEPVTHAENVRRGRLGVLRTHCVNGHEYTADNLYIDHRGRRNCHICVLAVKRRWREKRRMAA